MPYWNYYSVCCGFAGICLFCYGFFLLNNHGESHSYFDEVSTNFSDKGNSRTELNEVDNAPIQKVVIMVIDALRYDFIVGKSFSENMPFVLSSINNDEACVFPCRVHLPTVTMPRIKAMIMGTISNFIDVILNFGSHQILQDNILLQATKKRKKVVFYGDDTWIKLFPNMFYRSEGTTSFFVSDFTEVDNNVTRNVVREIIRDDWDIMILHYLGLDHIGHLEGPTSSKILQKLLEMDEIIKKINQHLFDWSKKSKENYLVIMCGDHGMKDSGGHGGSTLAEVLVPFVTFGTPCAVHGEISQVDIAVTLSTLLQLPIPRKSVGKLIPGLIENLSIAAQLEAYYDNAKQLMKNRINKVGDSIAFKEQMWLNKAFKFQRDKEFEKAIFTYQSLLSHLSSQLIGSLTQFDTLYLYMAVVLMLQASVVPNTMRNTNFKIYDLMYTIIIAAFMFSFIGVLCYYFQYESLLCSCSFPAVMITFVTLIVTSLNIILIMKSIKFLLNRIKNAYYLLKQDSILAFLTVGTLLQIISCSSTSFIEEEHMVWYFLWTTFLILSLRNVLCNTTKEATALLTLMISHRILQKLNQTGDKWAKLPAMSDWLKLSQNKSYLSIFTIAGLIWIFISLSYVKDAKSEYKMNRITSQSLNFACLTSVYLYRAAVKDVELCAIFQPLLSDRGILEFHIYLYTLAASAVFNFMFIFLNEKDEKFVIRIVEIFIKVWILLICILIRTYNIVLLGTLVIISNVINRILMDQKNKIIKMIIIHHWLARVCFFYQGNSNSLASIDIAAGYVGQSAYNFTIAGVLIFCCTYAMPILSYFLMLKGYDTEIVTNYNSQSWNHYRLKAQLSIDILISAINFHATFVMAILLIHRYHLFIWSVFSPKLLYISVYTTLLYLFIVALQFSFNCFF